MVVRRGQFICSSALLLLATCRTASALDYQIQANIRYDQYPETVLDILQPSAPSLADRPGVIVIHGGGWMGGSKEEMLEEYCLPFVRHGMVVANVEYRLAPSAPAPAAVNDVLKAAQWFEAHAAGYKVDPKKIVAAGGSAGGHLALMIAMTPASAALGPASKIAAVIDFFGITDVAALMAGPTQREFAAAWIPPQPDRMELARRVSPSTYVRKGLPPILILHGDADPTVPYQQSVALAKALKSAGDDATLITIPGGGHGFTLQEMVQATPQIFLWLKKHKIGS
jgi:acetyl esterase/lipase